MSIVNFLHITDIHITNNSNFLREFKKVAEKFKTEIEKDLQGNFKDWKPRYVLVSGDLTFSGEKKEYDEAYHFLEGLRVALGLNSEDFIFCCGNHDSIQEVAFTDTEILNGIATRKIDEANSILKLENLENINKPFVEFGRFLNRFYRGNKNALPDLLIDDKKKKNATCGFRLLAEHNIGVNIINTSWFCIEAYTDLRIKSSKEKGRADSIERTPDAGSLYVGNDLITSIEDLRAKENVRTALDISVFHHGFHFWGWEERFLDSKKEHPTAMSKVIAMTDLAFNGHEHGNLQFPPLYDMKMLVFAGGAFFEEATYRNNCSIVQVDTEAKTVKRLPIKFKPSGQKWDVYLEKEEVDNEEVVYYMGAKLKELITHHRIKLKVPVIKSESDLLSGYNEKLRIDVNAGNVKHADAAKKKALVSDTTTEQLLKENGSLANAFKKIIDANFAGATAVPVKESDKLYLVDSMGAVIFFFSLQNGDEDLNELSKLCGKITKDYSKQKLMIIVYDISCHTQGGSFEEYQLRRKAAVEKYKSIIPALNDLPVLKEKYEFQVLTKLEFVDNQFITN